MSRARRTPSRIGIITSFSTMTPNSAGRLSHLPGRLTFVKQSLRTWYGRSVMSVQLDRRTFLGATATGLLVLPAQSGRAAPSERVRVAVIGLRSRGYDHAKLFASDSGAEVVAVCDVDDAMFARPVKTVESTGGRPPRTEK